MTCDLRLVKGTVGKRYIQYVYTTKEYNSEQNMLIFKNNLACVIHRKTTSQTYEIETTASNRKESTKERGYHSFWRVREAITKLMRKF